MKVTRTVVTTVHNVERCQDCPYFKAYKEGPECAKMDEVGIHWPKNIIYPEGRDAIHPDCPLLKEKS